jgi:hypothetical protein
MAKFDPAKMGYPLRENFDRIALEKLLFELSEVDEELSRHLREKLLGGGSPYISQEVFEQLKGLSPILYGGFSIPETLGRSVSEVLFGKPLG